MILASHSKRRQEILKDMGFKFKVITADIEEVSDKKDISERILDIAEKKLDKISKDNINDFVLAADTVVAICRKEAFAATPTSVSAQKATASFIRASRLKI